jgi:iron complex transport system ATP-binding protein
MNTMPMLQATGVHVRMLGREVLKDVTVPLAAGWTAIVGPNGAGKSTLLRALAGLVPLAQGQVCVQDAPLHTLQAAERARRIAWLAQSAEVSGDLSVEETVALGRLAQRGLVRALDAHDAQVISRAMQATGCTAWAARQLTGLSGGERQRVLLARVLATEAPVLLLDEPTTHLDAPHQVALARLFRRLAQPQAGEQPRTVVTVLHDLPIALRADQVLVMQDGRLVAAAPPASTDLHRALEAVFSGAVRVFPEGAGARVALALDE